MGTVTCRLAAIVGLVALALAAGCEKASHDNIDKWLETEKGPGKLREAMKDSDLGADLRGHAAVNLIRINREQEVYEFLEKADEGTRGKLVAEMVPRLWDLARVEGRLTVPNPVQTGAKDALFFLRDFATDDTKKQIDTYLIDWLTGGQYKGRSASGRVKGDQIVRTAATTEQGARTAADQLITALNAVLAAPPDEQGAVLQVSDEMIRALALTGEPKAVAKLLEIANSTAFNKTQKNLKHRVLLILEAAYTEPVGVEPADPRGLQDDQIFAELVRLSKDERESRADSSAAIDLVRAAGMPKCLPALVQMIPYPHSYERFHWMAAQRALDCGQVAAITSVAEAFLTTGEYSARDLDKLIVAPAAAMTPRAEVAEKARLLLSSDSWVARLIGVELLGKLALQGTAAEDADRIAQLAGDRTRLKGYAGEGQGGGTKDPTLGDRAKQVANQLRELAKGSPK